MADKPDLVERLRNSVFLDIIPVALVIEAVREIERLRKQVADLEEDQGAEDYGNNDYYDE